MALAIDAPCVLAFGTTIGTGTFTETQNLNYRQEGTGSITLLGTMHTD
jgi:hypothetical protein